METTESTVISILLGYMYFADISIVNSGVREAFAHVYHLVYYIKTKCCLSVGTFFGTHIALWFLHPSTPDLLEIKGSSSGSTQCIFKRLCLPSPVL